MKKITAISFLVILSLLTIKLITYQKIEVEKAIKAKANKKKIRIAGMGIGATGDPNNKRNWSASRLVNPETKMIPKNIRARELNYAQKLPKNNFMETNWIPRGPYNVGGRTRAMVVDFTNENISVEKI